MKRAAERWVSEAVSIAVHGWGRDAPREMLGPRGWADALCLGGTGNMRDGRRVERWFKGWLGFEERILGGIWGRGCAQ